MTAMHTQANVSVSDGSRFETETFFHTANEAAIRQRRDDETTIAVEGPFAWESTAGTAAMAGGAARSFVLGHQFHALFLYFAAIVGKVRPTDGIRFGTGSWPALSGELPGGGTIHLVGSDVDNHPAGLRLEFPDVAPIEAAFGDWRDTSNIDLPWHVRIDDGRRVFDYAYSEVDVADRNPLWFQDMVTAPDLDAVRIYRLHRRLLAAHCLGDAALIADLTAPEAVIVSRGRLTHTSPQGMLDSFTRTFQRFDYTSYSDLVDPIVDVSGDGSIGWIAVQVSASGTDRTNGEAFDDQWAWTLLVRKSRGTWQQAGNASSHLE